MMNIGTKTDGKRFKLPDDVFTQTLAMLARKGAGKTHTATVLAEEMLAGQQAPVGIIDPVGVFWGLRSSKDGKRPGFPILILGGDHGDAALDPAAGKIVADFMVDQRISAVLDLSAMGENEMTRFVASFCNEIYRRNRSPFHLIVDEADEFAPQAGYNADGAKCLGAMQRIVRRGRARGIGVTLITQRSAVLNKSVLTQTECLFALQTTGPHDLKAIAEWLKYHAGPAEADRIIGRLPSLPRGHAFVYSPGWLRGLFEVEIRDRKTFDSSSTPEVGSDRTDPTRLADIDLDALTGKMAEAIEAAKENDPSALRARIRELEAQAKRAVAADPDEVDALKAENAKLRSAASIALSDARAAGNAVTEASGKLELICSMLDDSESDDSGRTTPGATTQRPVATVNKRSPTVKTTTNAPEMVGGGKLRMLTALRMYAPTSLTRRHIGLFAGIVPSGGTFQKYFGQLRADGLIEDTGGGFTLTDAGMKAAAGADDLPNGAALIDYWRSRLGSGGKCAMFDALVDAWPSRLSREQIGECSGVAHTGGTFQKYLGQLRKSELIDVDRDGVTAASELFDCSMAE